MVKIYSKGWRNSKRPFWRQKKRGKTDGKIITKRVKWFRHINPGKLKKKKHQSCEGPHNWGGKVYYNKGYTSDTKDQSHGDKEQNMVEVWKGIEVELVIWVGPVSNKNFTKILCEGYFGVLYMWVH